MKASTSTVTGCGNSACSCLSEGPPVARINGRALYSQGQRPDDVTLREIAFGELLRQEAVRQELLEDQPGSLAPELSGAQRSVIETMLDREVAQQAPNESECRRFYDANLQQFVIGQAVHLRHILFAVTPGVNVHALTVRAEQALLELSRKDTSPERFAALAAELSNCPSGAQGGDLGWVGPDDCASELANELFQQKSPQWGIGVHPRLVHTRFGFHIIEVIGRRKGRQASFDEVRERVQSQLTLSSRARGLNQYMAILAGKARVEGVVLDSAETPLVQ